MEEEKKVEEEKSEVKEPVQLEDKNELTDEELYAKIQTDKLLKKKKASKIATVASMAIVLVLAIVIIVLACVPISLKPTFLNTENYTANVYINFENEEGTFSKNVDETEFKEFQEILNTAFNQTYFSGIFNGSLEYNISEKLEKKTSLITGTEVDGNKNYIHFCFNDSQKLTYKNGKTYASTQNRSVKSFEFNDVYMTLSTEEGLQDTTFYVVVKYVTDTTEDVGALDSYIIRVTVKANTFEIYDKYNPVKN